MGVANLSLRQKLGLKLFRQHKALAVKEHKLSYLMWECTLRCNLCCKHCGSDCRKNVSQKDMPLADFLKVVDSITPHVNPNNTMVVLTGGEPLLRPDLEACGLALYKRGYPWGIVSNGMALTEKRLHSLIASGLRSATISLDGLEASHNAQRGHPQSFQNAINAIKYLQSQTDELVFDVVSCISRHTFPQLQALKQLLIDMGVKQWRIFTIFPVGRAASDPELQLQPVEFKQLFDFIQDTRKEGKITLSYGCEGFLGAYESKVREGFFFCRAGVNVGSVLVDGSISACPNLRARFIQGNIYKDDFMTIWNQGYAPFRNREWARTGICKDCKFFSSCQGNGMHLRDEDGSLLFCHLKRIQDGER